MPKKSSSSVRIYKPPIPEYDYGTIGHRGNGAGKLENTLASCQDAVASGAEAVEVDIQLIDGKLYTGHDSGVPAQNLKTILEQIKVPLVLHLRRRGLDPRHDREAVRTLYLLLRREDISVASFWPGTLRYMHREELGIRTIYLSWWPNPHLWFSRGKIANEYCSWHRTTNNRTVAAAKRRGVKLSVFTVPAKEKYRRKFRKLSIRRIVTDHVKFFATK